MEVALAIGRTHAHLAVRVEVARRDADVSLGLEHEQIGLSPGVKLQPVGRAMGNDDVIIGFERQQAEH